VAAVADVAALDDAVRVGRDQVVGAGVGLQPAGRVGLGRGRSAAGDLAVDHHRRLVGHQRQQGE
jgi:hypothetical protein